MSKKRPSYIPEDLWIEDLPSYMLQVAYQYLPLDSFGFHETYRDDTDVILNSEKCRIDFHARWEPHPYAHYTGEYKLSIWYGRLHAPNESLEMEWQGERCQCWLAPWNYFFDFVDHAFPNPSRRRHDDIFMEWRSNKGFPSGIHWRMALEAETWKHYTPELFDLFDLRRPELWEQYRAWLKARYIAEGQDEKEDERYRLIPYYRVC